MAAFRAGMRWADIPSDSFSRSKTAGIAGVALQLQAEQAEQSYAPGEAVVLPEFENSHAGMNQFFAEAAALGPDSKSHSVPQRQDEKQSTFASPVGQAASGGSAADRDTPAVPDADKASTKRIPGFRGLLVGAPAEADGAAGGAAAAGAGAAAKSDGAPRGSRERSAAALNASAMLTPAKRNRRTSQAATASSGTAATGPPEKEGPARSGLLHPAAAAAETAAQKLPVSKRRKSAHPRDSVVDSHSSENAAAGGSFSAGVMHKRRSARGSDRRRSGGARRASEGQGMLLQIAAPPFLQLPGLVSPVFMPVGLTPNGAAPLPGLLHPRAVHEQQARSSNSKQQQDQADEEEWQRRECARMRDIAIGKATTGYRNFLKTVGRESRSEDDPSTPDPKQRCSKAQFQRAYLKWRRQLHQYDTVEGGAAAADAERAGSAAGASPDVGTAGAGDAAAAAAADPAAGDDAEQKELEAILAFNKECEMAGL